MISIKKLYWILFIGLPWFIKAQETTLKKIPLNIELQNISGEKIMMSDLVIDTDFTILDFWSVGCAPCIAQLNFFAKNYDTLINKGLKVLAISVMPPNDAAKRLLEKYNWPFDVYFDSSGKLFKKYNAGNISIPLSVILDADWKIVTKKRGAPMRYLSENEPSGEEERDLTLGALKAGNYENLVIDLSQYFNAIENYKKIRMGTKKPGQ